MKFGKRLLQGSMGLALLGALGNPIPVLAQNAKVDALNQAVSQWLQNPGDADLGKTVVKQAKALKGAPKPKEYTRHLVMGKMAFKDAKSPADFQEAVNELQSATEAAPWIADGWYNLGMAKKMAAEYTGAENDMNLYLLLSPRAKDAEEVQKTIYEIEYAAKKTGEMGQKQKEANDWLKNLDGARFVGPPEPTTNAYRVYEINGQEISVGYFYSEPPDFKTSAYKKSNFNDGKMSEPIQNKHFEIPWPAFSQPHANSIGTISDDGQFITITDDPFVYRRAR